MACPGAEHHLLDPVKGQYQEPQEDDGGKHGSKIPGNAAEPWKDAVKELIYGEKIVHRLQERGRLLAFPFRLCR